jgi:hypothetical protein
MAEFVRDGNGAARRSQNRSRPIAGEQTADDDPAGPTFMEAIADNLVSDRCSEGPCEIADRIEGRSPQRLQVSDFGSI